MEYMHTSTPVKGSAYVRNVVSYYDMANQDGTIYEVISTPRANFDEKSGTTKGFGLRNLETGAETFSDLRQIGWHYCTPKEERPAE